MTVGRISEAQIRRCAGARIKLKRTQTIIQGATHCDFDYTFEE